MGSVRHPDWIASALIRRVASAPRIRASTLVRLKARLLLQLPLLREAAQPTWLAEIMVCPHEQRLRISRADAKLRVAAPA
jgi:hypothetical protein